MKNRKKIMWKFCSFNHSLIMISVFQVQILNLGMLLLMYEVSILFGIVLLISNFYSNAW